MMPDDALAQIRELHDQMSDDEHLLTVKTTIRFNREKAAHDYRIVIDGKIVRVITRCGRHVESSGYMEQGIVSCTACIEAEQ